MFRKAATVRGIVLRIVLLIAGTMAAAWLFGARGIFSEPGLIIAAAVILIPAIAVLVVVIVVRQLGPGWRGVKGKDP